MLRLVRAALKTRNDHQGCVAWPGLALTRKNNILNSFDNVTAADTHDTEDDDEECWRKLARLDSDDDSVGAAATDDNVVTNQQDISKSVSGAHNNDDDSPQLIVPTASADNIITVQILSSYQLSTIDQSHEDLNYMERTIYIYVKTEPRVLGFKNGENDLLLSEGLYKNEKTNIFASLICCCPFLISVNNNNLGLEEWLHNLCSNLFVAAATCSSHFSVKPDIGWFSSNISLVQLDMTAKHELISQLPDSQ